MYKIPESISEGFPAIGQGPLYKEIAKGVGIDPHEYQVIKKISVNVYMSGIRPLSKGITEGIKAELGGEWFAFVNPIEEGEESYELCITRVKGTDFISFVLDNTKFQVCRIREYAREL